MKYNQQNPTTSEIHVDGNPRPSLASQDVLNSTETSFTVEILY